LFEADNHVASAMVQVQDAEPSRFAVVEPLTQFVQPASRVTLVREYLLTGQRPAHSEDE
jgi:hypothetical protein